MSKKNSPLTPAERVKRYRTDHTMIGVERRLLPSIVDLQEVFAKELNDPDLPRSTVFSRIILEAHHRYCRSQAAVTCTGSDAGIEVPEVLRDLIVADLPEGAMGGVTANAPVVPVLALPEAVTANIEIAAIPVISNDHDEAKGHLGGIMASSSGSPVTFPSGKIWKEEREEGSVLVVKFFADIHRKEFLKHLKFECDYKGDKSWSKECIDSDQLTDLAGEVIKFMNSTPEEQLQALRQ